MAAAIMTGTRYDPHKKFKKATGDPVTPTATPITPVTGIETYAKYVPYVLGAVVIGIVIWKLSIKK
jgi:hypothetical protein